MSDKDEFELALAELNERSKLLKAIADRAKKGPNILLAEELALAKEQWEKASQRCYDAMNIQ